MRIQQLRYLEKVIESGSMTQAAKELFIAQPTLSMPSSSWKRT